MSLISHVDATQAILTQVHRSSGYPTHLETEHNLNKTLLIIAFTLGSFASPVQAQTMPRYNVEIYCQQVAEVSGGSTMIFNGCMEMEQEAYNGLKPTWAQLPGKSRNYCDEVARVSGGSYSILQGCMEMETDAAKTPRSFIY